MDIQALPDETVLPGHSYSLGEMRSTIRLMRSINSQFYATVFSAGVGSRCHAFVEFAGLQAKFIDFCEEAMNQGVEFPFANTHGGIPVPLAAHHVEYLGEKFDCIYGFAIGGNKELRDIFIAAALGPESAP